MQNTPLNDEQQRLLKRANAVANRMDSQWSVAGVRFGWDGVLGLIPGAGDVLAAIPGLYIVWIAVRLKLPKRKIFRMLTNILCEVVLGALPMIGDIMDVVWRANRKNAVLMNEYFDVIQSESTEQANKATWLWVVVSLLGSLLLIYLLLDQ